MKAKQKQVRETRATYHVSRTKSGKAKSSARRGKVGGADSAVPWEKRHERSWRELETWRLWLNDQEAELEKKYPGKYLAIWDKEIIAEGNSWGGAWDAAMIARPDIIPLVAYIPTEKESIFAL